MHGCAARRVTGTCREGRRPCILGWIVKDLADAALRTGEIDRALGLLNEAIVILEATGWNEGLAAALTAVGRALRAKGRLHEAGVHHGRALRTATELGQPYAIAEALEGMAKTVAASDDPERAVELSARQPPSGRAWASPSVPCSAAAISKRSRERFVGRWAGTATRWPWPEVRNRRRRR